MSLTTPEIALSAKAKQPSPSASIVAVGTWLRIARIKDEDWTEEDAFSDTTSLTSVLATSSALGADIFTFSEKINHPIPRFSFPFEWDSIAAVPIDTFAQWWEQRVSSDLRKDVRRAAKRGVEVRSFVLNDQLVHAIKAIYDETPIRQGRPFWHYHEPLDVVRAGNSTFSERSTFLGAFVDEELIGFLKIVYVGRVARLMQIIAKDAHRDKRPMNALIAKAVEVSALTGCTHLTYGKYHYPQGPDSVTAFKHRNGFEEILVPKYFVPLSLKGRGAVRLGLHRGWRSLLPVSLLRSMRAVRAGMYSRLKTAAVPQ